MKNNQKKTLIREHFISLDSIETKYRLKIIVNEVFSDYSYEEIEKKIDNVLSKTSNRFNPSPLAKILPDMSEGDFTHKNNRGLIDNLVNNIKKIDKCIRIDSIIKV